MLGMIRNSLFGSVETWPWQVLSTGGKVGPQSCREPDGGLRSRPHPGPGWRGCCETVGGTVTELHSCCGRDSRPGAGPGKEGRMLSGSARAGCEKGSILESGILPVECICPFKHSKPSELPPSWYRDPFCPRLARHWLCNPDWP